MTNNNDEQKINDEKNVKTENVEEEIVPQCKSCEEHKSRSLRAQADYQNLQKEVEKKRSEWVKLSEAQILEDFIPVYDNFKKAFNHEVDAEKFNNWKKGIEYIMKQFGDILVRYNIEIIKTVGEKFNPELHEAVGEEEVKDIEAGTIAREVESGYKTGDRVIKCAKVIISK